MEFFDLSASWESGVFNSGTCKGRTTDPLIILMAVLHCWGGLGFTIAQSLSVD